MKRQRLTHWRTPHGGMWNFLDPRDGKLVQAQRYDLLDAALKKKSAANGWPIGLGWDEWVEDILCKAHPEECSPTGQKVNRRRRMGLADVLRGTIVMGVHKLAGSPLVDQTEADRRAAICAVCPRNVLFAKPCSGMCEELKSMAASTIGDKHVARESELEQCDICGCWLRVAVWFPLEIQCQGTTQTMREDFAETPNCWKQCV